MLCVRCDMTVDDLWWWCPDCGGVVREAPILDLRDDSRFAVEWYAEDTSARLPHLQAS